MAIHGTTQTKIAAPSWQVWLALWIVYIVWGSTYLAIRITVETMPPLLAAGMRFLLAAAVLLTWLAVRRGPSSLKIDRRQLIASTAIGSALLLGGNGLVMVAEQHVSSSLAALLIASVSLWVIVYRKIAGERIPGLTLAGVVIGFVGVGVLVLPGSNVGESHLFGTLLVLIASACWAFGSFMSKRVPLPSDPWVSTGYQMLGGGLVVMLAGIIGGELADVDPSSFSTASILGLLYLVVAGSLLAFTAYVWLLQNAPISKVATYAYVNPMIAIVLGAIILDESITATMLVGAAAIIGSVALVVANESRLERTQKRESRATAEPALDNA
jgi:drug/metabolite transporter (DMT)-like permease